MTEQSTSEFNRSFAEESGNRRVIIAAIIVSVVCALASSSFGQERLRGRVVKKFTDTPIAMATVKATCLSDGTSVETSTALDGSFDLLLDGDGVDPVLVEANAIPYKRFSGVYDLYETAWLTIGLDPLPDWRDIYEVTYWQGRKRIELTRGASELTTSGILLPEGGAKDRVKIKVRPGFEAGVPIPVVWTHGSFRRFYTEAPVAILQVDGDLKNLVAKGCHVESITAATVGKVKVAVNKPGVVSPHLSDTPTSPQYAYVSVTENGAFGADRSRPPFIHTCGAVVRGVRIADGAPPARIVAMSKKYEPSDGGSSVSFGAVGIGPTTGTTLIESVGGSPDLFWSGPRDVTADEIQRVVCRGGPINAPSIVADRIDLIQATGAVYTIQPRDGEPYVAPIAGDIFSVEIISGLRSRALALVARGGSIAVGDEQVVESGLTTGGVITGGRLARIVARAVLYRDGGELGVLGGRVGFVPDALKPPVLEPVRVAVLADGPWMRVCSGQISLRSQDAFNYDIGRAVGDIAVFGVFIAGDNDPGEGVSPGASVGLLKTLSWSREWEQADAETWWFRVAGFGYSREAIRVRTGNDSGFVDMSP